MGTERSHARKRRRKFYSPLPSLEKAIAPNEPEIRN